MTRTTGWLALRGRAPLLGLGEASTLEVLAPVLFTTRLVVAHSPQFGGVAVSPLRPF